MRTYKDIMFKTSALPWTLLIIVLLFSYTSIADALQDGNTVLQSKRDYILIGHPNPSTGPLAIFGETSPWIDERMVKWINDRGGIYIKEYGRKLPVKVKVVDTESNPTKTIKITTSMIVEDKVDMIVVLHAADTVLTASAVCEKFGVPCISGNSPMEAWLSNGPHKWAYHSCWTLDLLCEVFAGLWDEYADQTNKVIGGLWPDDNDAKQWQEIFYKKLTARGYTVVNYSGFQYMTNDFSPAVKLFKSKNVEILTGVIISADLLTFWRQSEKMNFCPKMATLSKAANQLSQETDLPDGLVSGVWWSPYHPYISSLTGENCKQLGDAWTKETGKRWTMSLGCNYAVFEVAFDALNRAQSLDKEKIRQAIETTDTNTLLGHIKYDDQHSCVMPFVAGQWSRNNHGQWEVKIVYNKQFPEIPKTGEFIFPLQNIQR
jgi:branched-chain amino acid transport system substrate-binding protein